MCIICISPRGIPQPSESLIRTMFSRNPHGAGYMRATGEDVEIHKGFMTVSDLIRATRDLTPRDAVVWHFRIATQAGGRAEMTQPFPLSDKLVFMEALDASCKIGVAHNGIIRMTSTGNRRYSDTALFVSCYLGRFLRAQKDLRDERTLDLLDTLTASKWALMDKHGFIATVGDFQENADGLLFSNGSWQLREEL